MATLPFVDDLVFSLDFPNDAHDAPCMCGVRAPDRFANARQSLTFRGMSDKYQYRSSHVSIYRWLGLFDASADTLEPSVVMVLNNNMKDLSNGRLLV